MIVRNESAIIANCLSSVKQWITHWVVVDTGSTDATMSIVREELSDRPGRLIEAKWSDDFAHHRNQGVVAARELVQSPSLRLLFIDADETMHVRDPASFRRKLRSRRLIEWWAVSGDWHFRKLAVVAADDVDGWVGARHEFIALRSNVRVRSADVISDAWIEYGDGGFRRRDNDFLGSDLEAIRSTIENSDKGEPTWRDCFFLARTHEVRGDWQTAAQWFERAVQASPAGGDDHWQSLWGQGRCQRHFDLAGAVACLQSASELSPERAEPLLALAEIARTQGMADHAVTLAQAALTCEIPRRSAMFDASAYGWRAADELALAAAELGDREALQLALEACEAHFGDPGRLPELERERLVTNLAKVRERLA